jgi:carbon-monoxide dehydrogenase small subunit
VTELELTLTVNGKQHTVTTAPHRTLLEVLREDLSLTGTKEACGQGDCGACVVVMDGRAVNSCLVLAPQANGSEVLTVESLEQDGELHPLQTAFAEKWGFQCGFCTPGMLMSAYALLQTNPDPTREEVKVALSGNLCRCTGYTPIFDSVEYAAELMKPDKEMSA